MNRIHGKTALITGASAGIGSACARALARHDVHLVLAARRLERLERLAEELSGSGARVRTAALDVRDQDDVRALHDRLEREDALPDILINNAGLAVGEDSLHAADPADWDVILDTNVKGVLGMIRAFVPDMVQRNAGHIVNVGSIAGHWVYPSNSVYIASKHAVRAITQSLSIDLLGTAVRVTAISPGMVETEFSDVRFDGDPERAKAAYAGFTPLTPEDVADAIVYATNAPSHVNIADVVMMATDQRSGHLLHRTP